MFERILIANRGEIACRIIRTARRMGIATSAVFSEADRDALHVSMADDACLIGPPPVAQSYNNIDAILAATRECGADAVHPGYGFLSENAEFAEACRSAGLVFIGPPSEAIRAMGEKGAAKAIMERAGVPVLPSFLYDGEIPEVMAKEAQRIGFPLLLKAESGGGGKGMRIVEGPDDMAQATASAQREAESSFGDGRLLVEKYLHGPRHVEVQIFADSHGNTVHLFERDCSLQRRHQKVIEEAPAPGLSKRLRREMSRAAVEAAKAVSYEGAGTVEFLLDGDDFYFIEMNTRLQVEHPVTEMITGRDLVEWQLRVATGGELPAEWNAHGSRGHAIEVRLYAEDPARGFRPTSGRIAHLRFPEQSQDLRIDAGFQAHDTVSIHYDPMLAKLIAWGQDRTEALRRMRSALAGCECAGLATNRDFLAAALAHPDFAAGDVDTGFIDRHLGELVASPRRAPVNTIVLTVLGIMLAERQANQFAVSGAHDPYSPWGAMDGWRLAGQARHEVRLRQSDVEMTVSVRFLADGFVFNLDSKEVAVCGTLDPGGRLEASVDGRRLHATFVKSGDEITLFLAGSAYGFMLERPGRTEELEQGADGRVIAPMPGRIVAIHVEAGVGVRSGTPLVVLEAMKMEQTIVAPADGVIGALLCREGDLVEEGAELVTLSDLSGEGRSVDIAEPPSV